MVAEGFAGASRHYGQDAFAPQKSGNGIGLTRAKSLVSKVTVQGFVQTGALLGGEVYSPRQDLSWGMDRQLSRRASPRLVGRPVGKSARRPFALLRLSSRGARGQLLAQCLQFFLLATAQPCRGGFGLGIVSRCPEERFQKAQESQGGLATIAISAGQCCLGPQDRFVGVTPGLPDEGDPQSVRGNSWAEHLAFPPGIFRTVQVSGSEAHVSQQAPGHQQVGVLADHPIGHGLSRGHILCSQVHPRLQSQRSIGDLNPVPAAHHLQRSVGLALGQRKPG